MMKLPYTPRSSSQALIIVAKQPVPGMTKTRLTPPFSPALAARLFENFLIDTIELVLQVMDAHPVLAFHPEQARPYFTTLAPQFELLLQEGANLGERLDAALTHFLRNGYQRVVIMDSDSPTLPLACLTGAFEALAGGADVVLGPTEDGGYYLIGLTRPQHRLLREVQMSTPSLTTDTLAIAAEEGLKTALLPRWYDIDTAEDLKRLQADLTRLPGEIAAHTRAFLDERTELLRTQTV